MNIQDAELIFAKFNKAMSAIGYFEKFPVLAIAVSGGSDSMALTLLANDWVKNQGGTLLALSVDHGLRESSRLEIDKVADWRRNYNIAHYCLDWSGEKKKNPRECKKCPL